MYEAAASFKVVHFSVARKIDVCLVHSHIPSLCNEISSLVAADGWIIHHVNPVAVWNFSVVINNFCRVCCGWEKKKKKRRGVEKKLKQKSGK